MLIKRVDGEIVFELTYGYDQWEADSNGMVEVPERIAEIFVMMGIYEFVPAPRAVRPSLAKQDKTEDKD